MDIMAGKTGSMLGKYIGAGFLLVATVLKALKLFALETGEIISVGIAIAAVFSTIDMNIIIEKFIKK